MQIPKHWKYFHFDYFFLANLMCHNKENPSTVGNPHYHYVFQVNNIEENV